jgi:ABC-type transporter Mla maintaining outer membrane lipid asymmetry permease subunit MlaE
MLCWSTRRNWVSQARYVARRVLSCPVLSCPVLYCAVLCCAVLCCTIILQKSGPMELMYYDTSCVTRNTFAGIFWRGLLAQYLSSFIMLTCVQRGLDADSRMPHISRARRTFCTLSVLFCYVAHHNRIQSSARVDKCCVFYQPKKRQPCPCAFLTWLACLG